MKDYPNNFDRFIGIIQLLDFEMNVNQTSNDALMKELNHQTQDYLDVLAPKIDKIIVQNDIIIKQNEKILQKLEK